MSAAAPWIKPTVGRVVWFFDALVLDAPEPQPLAAMVTYVHSETMVNLVVFDANGVPTGRTSIELRQPGTTAPAGPFCEWMLYQVGQAAKHEPSPPAEDVRSLPSRFQIGATVRMKATGHFAKVRGAHFTESKVSYDLETDHAITPMVASDLIEPA